MPIMYDSSNKIFNIMTPNTSYVIGVLNGTYLLHLYYGKRINSFVRIADEQDNRA